MHQDRVRHYFSSHTRVVSRKSCWLTSAAPPALHRVTEQPHKIPYYAALLKILHEPPPSEIASGFPEGVSLGRSLLEDFWKGFQGYLDQLAWREIRLCVSPPLSVITTSLTIQGPQIQFFAHLTTANITSPQSMISLLLSFTTVLDEFGVSQGRAKRAALCAVEGLLMVRSPHLIQLHTI